MLPSFYQTFLEKYLNRQVKAGSQLIVAMDRTQWKENNVLMVSVIHQKRAWPIYWCMLEKEGSSNLQEQQKVLKPVIRLLKKYKIVVIGDREFHSVELAKWLHRQKISFVFRQKQNTTFREKRQKFMPLGEIPIYPGIRRFYPNVQLTQKPGFGRFNLAVYWKRKYRGKQEDEAWYLLTNLPDLETAVKIYGNRFGIEAMFKDCKTGGYNLEGSKANTDRLVRLIFLIALAMTSAWLHGQRTKLQRIQPYVSRLGKPTQSPTLRWVFQCFQAVHLVLVSDTKIISNLTQQRKFILQFLGAACQKYYLLC
jgi:hypothetical protein